MCRKGFSIIPGLPNSLGFSSAHPWEYPRKPQAPPNVPGKPGGLNFMGVQRPTTSSNRHTHHIYPRNQPIAKTVSKLEADFKPLYRDLEYEA